MTLSKKFPISSGSEPEVSIDAVEQIGDVGSNDKPVEQETCDVLGNSQAI